MTITTTIVGAAPPEADKGRDDLGVDVKAPPSDGIEGDAPPLEKPSDVEQQKTEEGIIKFSRLGWKRLTVLLIVEAVAIGALSLPQAFARLGMFLGVILNVCIGIIAVYTGYLVGQVKLKYPQIHHYADAGWLLLGRTGYEGMSVIFVLLLVFLSASHCLTGATAFNTITDHGTCSVVFSVVSAVLLLLLSIPPSFAEVAILGYIDFVSIVLAIGITIIATGVRKNGIAPVPEGQEWSAWPQPGLNFQECFVAILNIMFAYSFSVCQFSFMDEMHSPQDYMKSLYTLGFLEVSIYCLTGGLIYAFVGKEVESPAILSAGPTVSKVAFGVALPVIFISGSIFITTAGRFIHGRMYANSVTRFVNTKKGWVTWLATVSALAIIGWVIAEAIPFFSDLVSLCAALFNSPFTFCFPAIMWFMILREGPWNSWKNLALGAWNIFILVLGLFCLVGGTYASIQNIVDQYNAGEASDPFTCARE